MALLAMSTQAGTLDDGGRQRIVEAIVGDSVEFVRPHTDEGGFSFEIGTNVVIARA